MNRVRNTAQDVWYWILDNLYGIFLGAIGLLIVAILALSIAWTANQPPSSNQPSSGQQTAPSIWPIIWPILIQPPHYTTPHYSPPIEEPPHITEPEP